LDYVADKFHPVKTLTYSNQVQQ
jgi:hypothetical protein